MTSQFSYPLAQITSGGRDLQGKKVRPTVRDLLVRPETAVTTPGSVPAPPRGLYLHVPFCFHKCHYCDFYSIVDARDRQPAFVARAEAELAAARPWLTEPVETLFVGGGTPTLLPPELWERLLEAIHRHVGIRADAEWTVEANPETVTPELVAVLAAGGVNRVSVGAQSFDTRHLRTLERWHEPANVARTVERARAGGIGNVSLDLIFGVPGQSLADWERDLDAAVALAPDHVSCYGLMFEPNTALTARLRAGTIARADPDLEATMYEATIDRLAAAGYEHYEISNWAKPGRRCRHNLLYWTDAPWWPIGPSASGSYAGWRWKNVARLQEWLDAGPLPPVTDAEFADDDGRVGEALMLGLRLVEGIERGRLEALLARGGRGPERRATIARAEADGLLARIDDHVRFTPRGRLVADTVLCDLI